MRFSTISLLVVLTSAERGVHRLRNQQHFQFHLDDHSYQLQQQEQGNLRQLYGGRGSAKEAKKNVDADSYQIPGEDEVEGVPFIAYGGGQSAVRTSKYGSPADYNGEEDPYTGVVKDYGSQEEEGVEPYTGVVKDYDDPPTDPPLDPPSPFDDMKDVYMSLTTTSPPTKRPTTPPTRAPSKTPSVIPSAAPSAGPSATPSAAPSTSPSFIPSASPSFTPSSVPSASPSDAPSTSPSAVPSDVPSSSPSEAPSVAPSTSSSESPSDSPTASPSVIGSTGPSIEPLSTPPSMIPSSSSSVLPTVTALSATPSPTTANPSSAPITTAPTSAATTPQPTSRAPSAAPISPAPVTLMPTEAPTTGAPITPAPTPSPTLSPSSAPSPNPTTASPTAVDFACGVNMAIERCEQENGRPCALITAIQEDDLLCDGGINGPPLEMGWIYRGTTCLQNTTTQNAFTCEDTNGGPPAAPGFGGTFIEVLGLSSRVVYFSAAIAPGNFVLMSTPDTSSLEGNVRVKVYEGVDNSGAELQTMTFSIRCSGFEDNTIGKFYGSLEMASYIDGDGVAVKGFDSVTYRYFVENRGDIDFEYMAVSNDGSTLSGDERTDITPENKQIVVGASVVIVHQYNVVLIASNSVEATGSVVGMTAGGSGCDDSSNTEFFIVRPAIAPTPTPTSAAPTPQPTTLAPISPAPTPQPTTLAPIAPAPTPVPPEGSCFVSAEARCSNGGLPCADIPALTDNELLCNVGGTPEQLGWFYRGTFCNATTTTQNFACTDFEGGPPEAEGDGRVFIEVQGLTTDTVYFFQSVLPGDFTIWVDTEDMVIEEGVTVAIYEGNNQAGTVLQSMVFSVACGDEDQDVRLGKFFGSLEFASYSGSNGEFVQSFVDVFYSYMIDNTGREEFELIELTSDINGDFEDLLPTPPNTFTVGGSETENVLYTVFLVNQNTPIVANVSTMGQTAVGLNCTATETYTFTVV